MNILPPALSTPASWLGPEMLNRQSEWLWTLRPDEIGDLERAVQIYIASSDALKNITQEKFSLPILGQRLANLRSELVSGRGFGVLRGLDTAHYSRIEMATLLSWYEGKLSGIYQRQYIDSAQRFEKAPELSDQHIKALDLFDALANDLRLNFSMQLETGDMQFVHNHSMLHDRNGFVDWPEVDKHRHLLRLWLSTPGDRNLPEVFAQRLGTVDIGNRGGVVVEGIEMQVPID